MKPSAAQLLELRDLAIELHDIMIAERDETWRDGIEAIIERLTPPVADEKWREVVSLYKTLTRVPGGLGDFHVWREEPDTRVEANKHLRDVRERLWTLIQMGI